MISARSTRIAALILLVLAVMVIADEDAFRFRSQSRFVLIDAVFTAKDSQFVTDLARGDVKVFEDGKEQNITFFQQQKLTLHNDRPTTIPSLNAARPVIIRPDRIQRSMAVDQASLVFLIDMQALSTDMYQRVKESLRDFIVMQMTSNDQAMLATLDTSLRIRQPFTKDKSKLLAALADIKITAQALTNQADFSHFSEEVENIFRYALSDEFKSIFQAAEEAAQLSREYISELETRMANTAEGVSAISQSLQTLPGRKHIVFYSAGYSMTPRKDVYSLISAWMTNRQWRTNGTIRANISAILGSAGRDSMDEYLKLMVDQANRAQVSLYTVDVRGLMAAVSGGEAQFKSTPHLSREGRDSQLRLDVISAPQDVLYNMAHETGGLWFFNSNDMSRGIRQAHNDSHQYYLIGYHSQNESKPGKYHRIDLEVNRPGIQVRARRGYLEMEEKDLSHREVRNAFKFPDLFHDAGMSLELKPENNGENQVTVFIPTLSLQFQKQDSNYFCPIEIYGALLEKDGRLRGDSLLFFKSYNMTFTVEELIQLRSHSTISTSTIVQLPDENLRLVVVIRQGNGSRMLSTIKPL